MTVFQALVLGIVQGLGEFLPISSSAHLVLIPWLFGWEDPGLTFDVALHMGTLLAVVLYFWKDWLRLIRAVFQRGPSDEKRIFWYLVVATIPGGLFGLAFENKAETTFRSHLLIGIMMIVMGILLYLADKRRQIRKMDTMTMADALWIGLSQALAIIPGVSRSGSTMTTARFLDIKREDAARFSFLMSTPIILGAGVFKLRHLTLAAINLPFSVGVLSSFIVGIISISFLLQYLKTSNFGLFVGYRFLVGLVVIGLVLAGH
ncbi:undecaprenyl-diphosphatase UppP [Desulfosporosinus sp. PR]|uniref:undecaprenyl-diphosphatase UppP n=1 Tax=Candidatus Desulfosporosinus nitrosoreducens TaxID=3401928 RepID=UPI0027E801FD|nr:undecaprenyl-diphosphatase UppP [Desulfosporosinus sp. PR]MDQ7096068.1 undecaprenyl-diphosphatase UppP [Desulfosporosinus sp. PR]